MATPNRGSLRSKIPAATVLAATDDLDGAATTLDVSGNDRVIIIQLDSSAGADGTAGIDTIQISNDGGATWRADPTILAMASDDVTGTVLVNGALNAAGVEPGLAGAFFKSGPHTGPTLMRCSRLVTQDANSAAWVTTAPSVVAIQVGA